MACQGNIPRAIVVLHDVSAIRCTYLTYMKTYQMIAFVNNKISNKWTGQVTFRYSTTKLWHIYLKCISIQPDLMVESSPLLWIYLAWKLRYSIEYFRYIKPNNYRNYLVAYLSRVEANTRQGSGIHEHRAMHCMLLMRATRPSRAELWDFHDRKQLDTSQLQRLG